MKTAKEEIRDLLEQLPEDASLEDIQYHIYVRQKVQKGLEGPPEKEERSHKRKSRSEWLEGFGGSSQRFGIYGAPERFLPL